MRKMQCKWHDHHSRAQFQKYLQKLFNLKDSKNLNIEDNTNRSFILHCNIDSYHLCKVRALEILFWMILLTFSSQYLFMQKSLWKP